MTSVMTAAPYLGRRNLSPAVRKRNDRLGRPEHWQLSRAIPKIGIPRCAERQAAIAEELDPPHAHDAAEWFGCDDGFDLAAYMAREARKSVGKALRAIRRQLRHQDREVIQEYREVLKERERQLEAQLDEIEYRWRRERANVPDIYARRRFLRDFIPFMEEQVANGAGPVIQGMLIEHQLELCELETLLIAA